MKSMSEAVRVLLEGYPMGREFTLWDLKNDLFEIYPPSRVNHADTVSRRLRESRYGRGFEIVCIDPRKSRYKKMEFRLKGKGGNHAT